MTCFVLKTCNKMQFVLAGKLLSGSPTEVLTKKNNVI